MRGFKKLAVIFLLLTAFNYYSFSAWILLPMDENQKNHLKAYGITYWVLAKGLECEWLLNYRGGSFVLPFDANYEKECKIRGVSYEIIADAQHSKILSDISNPEVNMETVKLNKAPKIAVYSPKTKQPWDDAVTLVLTYAEIPFDVIYDDEVMQNKLLLYDWLHLHHEDFTGQQGKFFYTQGQTKWYQDEKKENEQIAARWGFTKVSQLDPSAPLGIRRSPKLRNRQLAPSHQSSRDRS